MKNGHDGNGVRHRMCPTKEALSLLPLPLGEAGRRPGEGAFRGGTFDESTLTPALSQRERENENRQLCRKIRAAESVPNSFASNGLGSGGQRFGQWPHADVAKANRVPMILQADVPFQWLVPGLLLRPLVEVVNLPAVEDDVNHRPPTADRQPVPLTRRPHRIFFWGDVAIERPAGERTGGFTRIIKQLDFVAETGWPGVLWGIEINGPGANPDP